LIRKRYRPMFRFGFSEVEEQRRQPLVADIVEVALARAFALDEVQPARIRTQFELSVFRVRETSVGKRNAPCHGPHDRKMKNRAARIDVTSEHASSHPCSKQQREQCGRSLEVEPDCEGESSQAS